ncbi:MAG: DUF4157 domain-containing protein [Terracidiphilus sp.]
MSSAAFAHAVKSAEGAQAGRTSRTREGALRINQPGDRFEREADRAAEQVVSGAGREAAWSLSKISMATPLQRECSCGGECEECKKDKMLQRHSHADANSAAAPAVVHDVLRGPGRPLDHSTRGFMESRFGHDFSGVRVFNDDTASQSARAVSANAYTVGEKIVFNQGRYAPDSHSGRRLLAHELAHVVQQSRGAPREADISVGPPNEAREIEANTAAAILTGASLSAFQPRPRLTPARTGLIQRQTDESSGPTGIFGKAKYLIKDLSNLARPSRWANARHCLEGLFPAMKSGTFDRWIPIACARTKSGILHNREWDAFGHCWIACEGTRQCGGPQTWTLGLGREVSREWESRHGGPPHDSLTQDISNQVIGRVASVKQGTCFEICDGLHKDGHLNLTAPEATCVDCKTYPASGEGPCPGAAAAASGGIAGSP